MEYFVTGATGLVGSHVVHQLVEDGHDVVAVTRSASNASHLPSEAAVVEGDIADKESLRDPMAGVDGVFHMAAWAYVGPGPENEAKAERINVGGTRNVLELVAELDVPKAVHTSSTGIFGETDGDPVDESDIPADPPSSVYIRTKWAAHYEVAQPVMDGGLPLVVVLPGNAFGRWDKPYGTNRGLLRNYLQGDLPMIPRDWESTTDRSKTGFASTSSGSNDSSLRSHSEPSPSSRHSASANTSPRIGNAASPRKVPRTPTAASR